MPRRTHAAIVHKEADLYLAECPEVGTVSQGKTVEEAVANLKEGTELYLEEFSQTELPKCGKRARATRCHTVFSFSITL